MIKAKGRPITRRAFLAMAGGVGTQLSLRRLTTTRMQPVTSGASLTPAEMAFIQPRPVQLDLWGRITEYGTPVRETRGMGTPVVRFLERNVVLPLLKEVHAPGSNPNNDLWVSHQRWLSLYANRAAAQALPHATVA